MTGFGGRRTGGVRSWAVAVLAVLPVGPAAAEGTGQPAELPSADYAGLQYVDSQGCAFLRAGTEGATLWVPRVTPGGGQVCGYPPSGRPVAVADEAGGAETGAIDAGAGKAAPAGEPVSEAGGYVVALGSFGFQSNVTKAVMAAEALGYPAMSGKLAGGEPGLMTVFAGPFDRKSDAKRALARLKEAGFPDAILMEL